MNQTANPVPTTQDEFEAMYPFASRAACAKAMREEKINGWAQAGFFGGSTRYRVYVIVQGAVKTPKKQVDANGKPIKPKRITAASICRKVYVALLKAADGDASEVDRAEYVARCVKQGINRSTAVTRWADFVIEFGE